VHNYRRKDCEDLIHAKHLKYQIVSIGGIDRLRVNFSDKTTVIKSWDDLYATLFAIEAAPDPLVPEGVQVQDPKQMTDADFANETNKTTESGPTPAV
jgi:hypothetical protein